MITKVALYATCRFTQENSASIVSSVKQALTTVETTNFTWINTQASNSSVTTAQKYSCWVEPEILICLYTLEYGGFHVINATEDSTKELSMKSTVKCICEWNNDGPEYYLFFKYGKEEYGFSTHVNKHFFS